MAKPRDMARRDELAQRLGAEIDSIISQRLAKIGDPVIRSAIEEGLRDQVYENIGDEMAGKIGPLVDESLKDIIGSIQSKPVRKRKTLTGSFRNTNDNGGKDDSGGKDSYTPPPRSRRYSSGGKDSGGK